MLPDASLEAAPALERAERPRIGERITALPIGVSLGLIVALSVVVRFLLALLIPAPWIFADELKYSELAKSFASTGHFAIRDAPGLHLGPLYPVLISPAWAAFSDVPHAYLVAKAINSVLMSLAAVPTYFLARRLLSSSWSLVAAGLALVVPSTVYAGTIMTESAFYPLFVASSLGILAALERPSARRQLGALGLIALTFLTRPQAISLVAAFVTAIVAVCATDAARNAPQLRAFLRGLRGYLPTWTALVAGLVALGAWESLRGRSVLAFMGESQGSWHQHYSSGAVAKWFLYHIAELDLYVGLLPFAAFLILATFAISRNDRRLRVFALASLSIVFWLALVVAFYTSRLTGYDPHSVSHVEDRYTFYAVPLLLIALLAWVSQRIRGSARLAASAALGSGALILVLPLKDLIHDNAVPDALAFLPWVVTNSRGAVIARPHVELLVAVVTIALALLFYRVKPPMLPQLLPLLVLLWLVTTLVVAERWYFAEGSLANAAGPDKAWIDHAIGPRARAVAIWSGRSGPHLIWEDEFFNRSVGQIYYLHKPTWEGLPGEERLRVSRRTGSLVDATGTPLRARFVLADPWVVLKGRIIARDRKSGMRLYRLDGSKVRISAL